MPLALLLIALAMPPNAAGPAPPAAPVATLKYLGHSCFVITTPAGHRLLIDPYSSGEWPGLNFPFVHADQVLVTHAHWDHDAWRSVRGKPKVIDAPGTTEGPDFKVTGLAGRHADTGGASVDYHNIVFVVETGGVRVCHLGDNGPLTPDLKGALGTVDVLLLPVDSEKRVLTYEQAAAWIDALAPRLVLPMHYLLPGLALPRITGIGTVDEWVSLQVGARRVPGDTIDLDPAALPPPGARQVEILTLPGQTPPDPNAPAPPSGEAEAAKRRGELAAAGGDLATALAEFTRAAALDPADAAILEKIGYLHLGASRPDRALEYFEKAIGAAGTGDPKTASTAWLGAGMANDLLGRREAAMAAYRKVIDLGRDEEHQVDAAKGYLERPYRED